MAIAGALVGVGAMLSFYVPLYPFLVFLFGVMAWFIAVIEAMVAAPMVAFGLTHPDNHDFLGSSQQGLMLLLGVFLRPVLMVIGLIAAMILSYVAFRIVDASFAHFIGDLFAKTPSDTSNLLTAASNYRGTITPLTSGTGSMISEIISMPLVLVMFCMIVYLILNQCYSLVYVLPDYIMKWIGGPTSQSGIASLVDGAKGAISGVSGAMQKGGESVVGGAGDVGSSIGGMLSGGSSSSGDGGGDKPSGDIDGSGGDKGGGEGGGEAAAGGGDAAMLLV